MDVYHLHIVIGELLSPDFAARIARQAAGDEYDIVIKSPYYSKFTQDYTQHTYNIIMTCLRINRNLVS